MSHWRGMFDNKYIGAWDLPRGDVVVTIDRVEAGMLDVPGTSAKKKKPIVYMRNTEKGFALNKTNAKLIAGMYGNDTAKWVGKKIALYATSTNFGGESVECVRVRPSIPRDKPKANGAAVAPAVPEEERGDAYEGEEHGPS